MLNELDDVIEGRSFFIFISKTQDRRQQEWNVPGVCVEWKLEIMKEFNRRDNSLVGPTTHSPQPKGNKQQLL